MAAFVGYIVQSNGIHFPWPISSDGTPFPYDAGSPPEQWDALPVAAKWQIILFIGFLEWFSESAGTHYMRGGTPGAFPKFSDNPQLIPHPVPLNLFGESKFQKYFVSVTYTDTPREPFSNKSVTFFFSQQQTDPFGFSKNKSAEAKASGLVKELNNGRLAQIGILGFLSEQKLEGSVPLLKGLVAHYDGEPMAPVSTLLCILL
jgi:hypothetical protein